MFFLFEPMEIRQLLSVNLFDGVLTIVGTRRADQIVVSPFVVAPDEFVRVNDNGNVQLFAAESVSAIIVRARAGRDTLTIETSFIPTTLFGGDGRDTIDGGFGNDEIFAGKGHDLIRGHEGNDLINAGRGNDTVSGGTGNDRLFGGRGSDVIDAVDVDLGTDTVSGGRGRDRASVDDSALGQDVLLDDIETVIVA